MTTSKETFELKSTFRPIPSTLVDPFRRDFPNYTDGLSKESSPGEFVLTPTYAEQANAIYNTELRSDDAWVVTFPKCGTTWTQELVWLITHDCDFEGAKESLGVRSPFLEFPYLKPKSMEEGAEMMNAFGGLETIERLQSPRVIKSHLPFHLLPPNLLDRCKVVYVARNPKDAIVSFYHHHMLIKFHHFSGQFEDFTEYFLRDEVMYAPFFPHVLEAWNLRSHPNLLFLFYEDLKSDLRGQLEKVAQFFGKHFTDEQFTRLTDHLRFDNFVKNEAVNFEAGKEMGFMDQNGRFIRKGKTGDWKNHFGPELNARVDRWIESNLKGTDLKFVTELEHQD